MKIVDNYTGYLAINAVNDFPICLNEGDIELDCEYAVIKVDKEVDNTIRLIGDILSSVHVNNTEVRLIEFHLNRSNVTFFGDNPNLLENTSVRESIMSSVGKIWNVEYEDEDLTLDIENYTKNHIRLNDEYPNVPSIIVDPEDRTIVFEYDFEDNSLRTYPLRIDYLLDSINKYKI